MAQQVIKPYVTVEDTNGLPYVGAQLFVYEVNSTTLRDIFTNQALSTAADNPATSNAKGEFPRLYTQAGIYKLRCETAAGVLIFEEDYMDTGLASGSGALPITAGGTGGITATDARTNLDVPSNSELAALAATISTLTGAIQNIVSIPQGYLTLTSGTPLITSDVSAGTTVYYTPFIGNLVPIYDGTIFNATRITELSMAMNASHTANTVYDFFVISDSGTVRLVTGPVWTTSTAGSGARGAGAGTTELTRTVGGIYTNANSMTARYGATTVTVAANRGTYVGTMRVDGTNGQVSCELSYGQTRRWHISNAYNGRRIIVKAGDATASWTYGTNTWRPSRNDSTNSISIVNGIQQDFADILFMQHVNYATVTTSEINLGIGVNSTTSPTGHLGDLLSSAASIGVLAGANARYTYIPTLGANVYTCLEKAPSAGSTPTFSGTESHMLLTASVVA